MDARFLRHWATWREFTKDGKTPADFLASASDETLVELLAVAEEGSPVERNIIATELTNRISRLHRNVAQHGDRTDDLLDVNQASLARADKADEGIRAENKRLRGETEGTSRYAKNGKRNGGL